MYSPAAILLCCTIPRCVVWYPPLLLASMQIAGANLPGSLLIMRWHIVLVILRLSYSVLDEMYALTLRISWSAHRSLITSIRPIQPLVSRGQVGMQDFRRYTVTPEQQASCTVWATHAMKASMVTSLGRPVSLRAPQPSAHVSCSEGQWQHKY